MNGDIEVEVVKEGDWVLLYIDERRVFLFRVKRGKRFESDKGVIAHDDIVGVRFGSKIKLSTGTTAYILKPLFYDFFLKYRRLTQVIYPKDLGYIILLSGIGPGSRVLEAGVGTGFLTTTLAHVVKPYGKVYAYEVRKEFYDAAKKNLELSGLIEYVDLRLGDVTQAQGELSDLDAVFFDLPDPWRYVDLAYSVLKPSKPLIVFIPTVNQVEKTVLSLKGHGGFIDVHAYELMLREYQVKEGATRPRSHMIGHTGYIVFARKVSRE